MIFLNLTFIQHCVGCPCLNRDRRQIGWRQGHWRLQMSIWWFFCPTICSKTIKPRWQIQLRWRWTITNHLLRINHPIRNLDSVRSAKFPAEVNPSGSVLIFCIWPETTILIPNKNGGKLSADPWYLVTNRFNTTYHALFKLFNRSQNKKSFKIKNHLFLRKFRFSKHFGFLVFISKTTRRFLEIVKSFPICEFSNYPSKDLQIKSKPE